MQDIIDISSKYKGNVFLSVSQSLRYESSYDQAYTWFKSNRDKTLYVTVCGGYPIHVFAHCSSGLHVSNMCSKYVESALRLNYVNNFQRVLNTLLVLTLTKVKASIQLIHMEDLNCFIRDARFVTIFLQDHALEVIVSTHM